MGDTVDVEPEPMIELRLVTSSLSAASLTNLHIGEYVTIRDRWFYVRGVSSTVAENCRVQLEDMDTGERVEASPDEIEPSPRWRRERDPSAVNARRAGLCQLRDLLITTPEPLRSELRPLTRTRLLRRLAATRPHGRTDAELRGSLLALRSIAHRVLQLTHGGARARTRDRGAHPQTRTAAARPARRWSPRRRAARALLVTPGTDQL